METPQATREEQDPKRSGPDSSAVVNASGCRDGVWNFLLRAADTHYNNQPNDTIQGDQQAVLRGPCRGPTDRQDPQVTGQSDKPFTRYGRASYGQPHHCRIQKFEFGAKREQEDLTSA